MTNEQKKLRIMNNLVSHVIFEDRPKGTMPQLKDCWLNDLLLKHICKLGNFEREEELGMILIAECMCREELKEQTT